MPLRLCFLVCDALCPEVRAAIRSQGLVGAEVRTLPVCCHGSAVVGAEKLAGLISETEADCVEIIGGRCLQQLTGQEIYSSKIRKLEHCLHLLCSPTLIQFLQKDGAQLLLPSWLACWQTHGQFLINKESVVRKLLLLDTGTDAQAGQNLADLAVFLNLPAERLAVGVEYLGLFLAQIAAEHRYRHLLRQKDRIQRQSAEAAMTLDLLGAITKAKTEPEVMAGIIDLFVMLFAPKRIYCLPVTKKGLPSDRLAALPPAEQQRAKAFYAGAAQQELTETGDGFVLRLQREDKTAAIVIALKVAFPQYIESYLNTALNISGVCALAVEHVRTLKKLLDTSRLAGKAELATEVLHNVGNTLNSISVASERIHELVQKSSCATLPGIVQLLEAHKDDLGAFFSQNAKGRKLPLYFARLAEQLERERACFAEEIGRQRRHIQQAAEIIRTQQAAAGSGSLLIEQLDLPAVIEDSLELFEKKIRERQIVVERSYAQLPPVRGDRHKILQVMANLISNAADSFEGASQAERRIMLRLHAAGTADGEGGSKVILEVEDNGAGMDSATMEQIFAFGFSNKKGGHGYGLHNAANLTAEMGGTLSATSQGAGKGAVFRLELPARVGRRRG